MAENTDISKDEWAAFLAPLDQGSFVAAKVVAESGGFTDFLLVTDQGARLVTRAKDQNAVADMAFWAAFVTHLHAKNPAAYPAVMTSEQGQMVGALAHAPAVMTSFVDGVTPRRATFAHCAHVGEMLARLHVAGADFKVPHPSPLTPAVLRGLLSGVAGYVQGLRDGLGRTLTAEADILSLCWPSYLPQGTIHGNPARVLFKNDAPVGLTQFQSAASAILAYDIALAFNAWCFEADVQFNVTKAQALLRGYCRVRPLTLAEIDALPLLCRGAALQTLVMRLCEDARGDVRIPTGTKDPMDDWNKLRFHQSVRHASAYVLDPASFIA